MIVLESPFSLLFGAIALVYFSLSGLNAFYNTEVTMRECDKKGHSAKKINEQESDAASA